MARNPTRSKPAKKTTRGMRAVSSAPARTQEVATDATPPDHVETAATGMDPARVSRKIRPYQHRNGAPTARMTVASAPAMSREQEYAFIRDDLRRLLVTSGILIVVMIGLLLVIGR